jgi:hypothetical protein
MREVVRSLNLSDPRKRFFAVHLNATAQTLLHAKPENVSGLINGAREVTAYLIKAEQYPFKCPRPHEPPSTPSPDLATIMQRGDAAAIHHFATQNTNVIGQDQLPTLCDWALERSDFSLLSHLVSKYELPAKQLNRFVRSVLEQKQGFGAAVCPLMLYDFHRLDPECQRELETRLFQQAVKWTLKQEFDEGAFDALLVADQMRQLPPKTLHQLLVWADNNDDFRLVRFLIKNGSVPDSLLNKIIKGAFKTNSFGEIAEAVDPNGTHKGVLTKGNERRIKKWMDEHFPKIQ